LRKQQAGKWAAFRGRSLPADHHEFLAPGALYLDPVPGARAAIGRIDLSAIDAIAGGADDPFTFLAGGAFNSTPGKVISFVHAAGQYRVEGDIDGNNIADFSIIVTSAVAIGVGAFIL